MSSHITLAAQPRDAQVKARAIRRQQLVPGVVYGRDFEPRNVQFAYLPVERAILSAGTSQLIALKIEGEREAHLTLVRDVQHDPVTGRVTHVDLYRVVAGQTVRVMVPVVQHGELAIQGANVTQLLESVEVECLPSAMPEHFSVDMARLASFDARVTVADLEIPEGVRVLSDPDLEIIQLSEAQDLEAKLEAEEARAQEARAMAAAEEAEVETEE